MFILCLSMPRLSMNSMQFSINARAMAADSRVSIVSDTIITIAVNYGVRKAAYIMRLL